MSETTKPHKQTNRSNQATSYGTKKEWHSKNCGHKLLHLTHDSNNNNNLSNHTDKVTHIERERERESDKINTAHITSPYKSNTTHKCTYYHTYMSVTATTTTVL
jgi:hypothetical protein